MKLLLILIFSIIFATIHAQQIIFIDPLSAKFERAMPIACGESSESLTFGLLSTERIGEYEMKLSYRLTYGETDYAFYVVFNDDLAISTVTFDDNPNGDAETSEYDIQVVDYTIILNKDPFLEGTEDLQGFYKIKVITNHYTKDENGNPYPEPDRYVNTYTAAFVCM